MPDFAIESRRDCARCHGRGFVTESVPYGNYSVDRRLQCPSCTRFFRESIAEEHDSLEIEEIRIVLMPAPIRRKNV